MANQQNPVGIPEPTNNVDSLWRTAQALKEAVEVLQGTRGNRAAALKSDLEGITGETTIIQGGGGGLNNVVEDLTPQLGGNLDTNGNDITNAGSWDIRATAGFLNIYGQSGIRFWQHSTFDAWFGMTTQGCNVPEGRWFRVVDSSGNDYIQIQHDGTDVNFTNNATTDWNISGITAIQLGGIILQDAVLTDYGITSTSPTSSAGAITFDLVNGNAFQVTLTENITGITLSNPPASGTYGECIIKFVQNATGNWTVGGWPAAVKWPGGTAPTITTTATTGTDIVTLKTWDGGTTWFGDFSQDYS